MSQTVIWILSGVQELNWRVVRMNSFRVENVDVFRFHMFMFVNDVGYVDLQVDAKSKKVKEEKEEQINLWPFAFVNVNDSISGRW